MIHRKETGMMVDEAIELLKEKTGYDTEEILKIHETDTTFSIIVERYDWVDTYFIDKTTKQVKHHTFHDVIKRH